MRLYRSAKCVILKYQKPVIRYLKVLVFSPSGRIQWGELESEEG